MTFADITLDLLCEAVDYFDNRDYSWRFIRGGVHPTRAARDDDNTSCRDTDHTLIESVVADFTSAVTEDSR